MIDNYEAQIRQIGNKLIKEFCVNNEVHTGVNGPYNDKETAVRNLSHLIVITSIEILKFSKVELVPSLVKMSEVLESNESSNGFFVMRNKKGKDSCNGVIGHAWVIEAYIFLYKVLKKEFFLEKANNIYLNHLFNYDLGLWSRPLSEVPESNLDLTFNHQLWFAASIAELFEINKDDNLEKVILRYLEMLPRYLKTNSNGLISHKININQNLLSYMKTKVKMILEVYKRKNSKPSLLYKEYGYHIFNLMAFARLKKVFPNHVFWSKSTIQKSLQFANSEELFDSLVNCDINLDASLELESNLSEVNKRINIYGFPYNVPGFEIYAAKHVFKEEISSETVDRFLSEQFKLTYELDKEMLGMNCIDKTTINYRIYEYYRALEWRN